MTLSYVHSFTAGLSWTRFTGSGCFGVVRLGA